MTTLSNKQLSQALLDALEMAGNSPVKLSVGKETFVVLREEDYKGWLETSYLLSSPENAKVLQEGLEAPLAQCKDLDDVIKW